ncbi:MAG: hypothetical protein KAJ21_00125 [Thermoplasmatales archaeon]|nr:hypothetical protein [Thermoplasmatales archaeon]
MKIKSRSNLLNDVIRDAKKYPKGWKAVIGKDENRFSNDYYIFNPNTGIYLLKEYQKNPFEIKGIGGKIARYVDDNIENEISKYSSDFGIVKSDILKISSNLRKGTSFEKILNAAVDGKDMGISMPMRGYASSSKNSYHNIRKELSDKQKKIDSNFEKIASEDGLYSSYD